MPQRSTNNPPPVIYHLNANYRPEDVSQRLQLVKKVCDVLHLKSNATKLLRYYANHENGDIVKYCDTQNDINIKDLERGRDVLKAMGIMGHINFDRIQLDWYKIYVYATYLNPDKTAHNRTDVKAKPVLTTTNKSIRAQLKECSIKSYRNDAAIPQIQNLSNAELEDVLFHFSNMWSQS